MLSLLGSEDLAEGGTNPSGCPTSWAVVSEAVSSPTGVLELENSPENGGGINMRNEVLPVGGVRS